MLALAASLAAVITGGIGWCLDNWRMEEAVALRSYVAAHMSREPGALSSTDLVDSDKVRRLLHIFGFHLSGHLEDIVYAKRCPTPGGSGIHLVLRTVDGPVTFLYMPEQHIYGRLGIHETGYNGFVKPFGPGSAAFISTSTGALDLAGRRIAQAVRADQPGKF